MIVLNKNIKPLHFRGFHFKYEGQDRDPKAEKAGVITNIIIMSKENGGWFDFTFEDYKRSCAPRTDLGNEEEGLNSLVSDDKIIDKVGQFYSVNDWFFKALSRHINIPVIALTNPKK